MQLGVEKMDLGKVWENYWDILVGGGALLLGIVAHLSGISLLSTILSAVAIGTLAVTVSEVAEILSEHFKEPYGSLILTFSAVAVEIIILFMILLEAREHPQVVNSVRNGIISTVLVDLNVLLGLAVLIGGLNYSEQEHNEDTSESYTTILFVASAMLLVPTTLSITSSMDASLKATLIIGGLLLFYYLVIFRFQTKTHIHFFRFTKKGRSRRPRPQPEEEQKDYIFDRLPPWVNGVVLVGLLGAISIASEIFSNDGVPIFKEIGMSEGLLGLFIAFITVAPELFTAIRAAKNDEMQRVVNIAMGASTVSIMLTVPAIILLSLIVGIEFPLVFNPLQVGALLLTVILVWKTTEDGETNYLEGVSHLILFLSYAVVATYSG
ncbi:MAG: sodium:proton exchanger [Epsilonproteobacteria bacterium]|nr:sodium:proton exchanger [Campylobacterota bacterium]NPA89639.1 sodium:proton exchanger [Campylobacterota bacterium]